MIREYLDHRAAGYSPANDPDGSHRNNLAYVAEALADLDPADLPPPGVGVVLFNKGMEGPFGDGKKFYPIPWRALRPGDVIAPWLGATGGAVLTLRLEGDDK